MVEILNYIEDENGRQLAIYKVNYGSKLFQRWDIIEKGKIREWPIYFTSYCQN